MAAIKLATITSLDTLHRVSDLIRHISSTSILLFICALCGTCVSADEGSEGHRHSHFVHELDQHLALGTDIQNAPLSHTDRQELQNLKGRLASLASYASNKRVRLLIDAEESEIQPVRFDPPLDPLSYSLFRRLITLPCVSWTCSTNLTHGSGIPINVTSRTPDLVC